MFGESPDSHRSIFHVGCVLLGIELVIVGGISLFSPATTGKIVAMIATTAVGGLAGAILVGLRMELTPWHLLLILTPYNIMHLCLFFPLFTGLYHQAVNMKIVGNMAVSAHKKAEKQKIYVKRLGVIGLPLFIWLPLPWTGTLMGAVVGYLMGMRTRKVFLIALSTMFVSLVSWIWGIEYMLMLTHMQTELTVGVVIFLVGLYLYFRLSDDGEP